MTRIILLALAKDPRDRIQGCEQFRQMLAGELEPPFPWKPVLLCAAPLLLGAALYVSLPHWQRWMERRLHPATITTVMDTGQIHDVAVSAVENYELLCRESAVRARKADGKRIAEQVPNTAVAQEFAQQIQEAELNMGEFAKAYGRAVGRLAQVNLDIAKTALRAEASNSRRSAYVEAIEQDLMQARAATTGFQAATLSQTCTGLTARDP